MFCLSLEIAHSEWEDITGYYHPGISERNMMHSAWQKE